MEQSKIIHKKRQKKKQHHNKTIIKKAFFQHLFRQIIIGLVIAICIDFYSFFICSYISTNICHHLFIDSLAVLVLHKQGF